MFTMNRKRLSVGIGILFILFLCTSCSPQADRGGPDAVTNTMYDGQRPTNNEVIIGAKNHAKIDLEDKINPKSFYTKEEGKELVRKHINLQPTTESKITFEGLDGKLYVYHVYDNITVNNETNKLTRGWYTVNPNNGEVKIHYRNE